MCQYTASASSFQFPHSDCKVPFVVNYVRPWPGPKTLPPRAWACRLPAAHTWCGAADGHADLCDHGVRSPVGAARHGAIADANEHNLLKESPRGRRQRAVGGRSGRPHNLVVTCAYPAPDRNSYTTPCRSKFLILSAEPSGQLLSAVYSRLCGRIACPTSVSDHARALRAGPHAGVAVRAAHAGAFMSLWHRILAIFGATNRAGVQQLTIPTHCQWAIDNLFVYQRSEVVIGERSRRTRISASTVSRVVNETFATFESELPSADSRLPLRILDIGAGLAMYHTHIDRRYQGRVEHYLCDKSKNEVLAAATTEHGGWHAKALPFYNSMECARDINVANGVSALRWHSLNATAEAVSALGPGGIDVAVSILSAGFHYPIDSYAHALHHVLRPNRGRLLLTLRRTTMGGQLRSLKLLGFRCATTKSSAPKWMLVVCATSR